MENGYLAKYFNGIAVKRLSAVEADTLKSNQHEYNGDRGLKRLFGTKNGRMVLKTVFLYMNDEEIISSDGKMTWYDAREKHPVRSEWRLYFPTTDVSLKAAAGDTLIICLKTDGSVLAIIAHNKSTIESQLMWLFDLPVKDQKGFEIKEDFSSDKQQIEFIARSILEQIGIDLATDSGENYLEEMIQKFEGKFPSTKEFSCYARQTVKNASPVEEPDDTLLSWIDREEVLFRTLEKYLIAERLRKGFMNGNEVDVDEFIKFSLSVQNRRKSRVGFAFENHLEQLLLENRLTYSRTPVTENRSKPDFIFPSIEYYRKEAFPSRFLTMLGVKSTCKDRWRQVLAEADRIEEKHLLTLEPAISENQTNEMKAKKVQLVLPQKIHSTYTPEQQKWLFTIYDFLKEVKEKQKYIQE